jgi:ubiquitin-like modifier-activating enzyme ATG7
VVRAYEEGGWGFVRGVLEKPGVLEELTGLAELQRQMQAMVDGCDFDDEENDGRLAEERGAGGSRGENCSDDDWAEI